MLTPSGRRASPIGIFDSGMGGLTVVRALRAHLPYENFVYLGDTARLPYGTKSGDTVTRYAVQAARALIARDIKMLVVACNTASSVALPILETAFAPLPVIGVVAAGAEAALAAAPEGPIAVIATEGLVKGEIARLAVERYLKPLLATVPRPRALVLGCTHFPALKALIAEVAGPDVLLVDSAETTAASVERRLRELNLLNDGEDGTEQFLVTDAPDRFANVGEIFLGHPIDPGAVEVIDL
jgi:glutamate racemase